MACRGGLPACGQTGTKKRPTVHERAHSLCNDFHLISHFHGDHFGGIPLFLLAALYEEIDGHVEAAIGYKEQVEADVAGSELPDEPLESGVPGGAPQGAGGEAVGEALRHTTTTATDFMNFYSLSHSFSF